MYYHRLLTSIAALLISFPLISQKIIDAHKLADEIVFDGRVDEPAWQGVPVLDMKMQVPDFGKEPSERSEVRMAYDEHYLYLSGKMFLSDPSYYRGTTYKRDAFDGTTDYFGFVIDSYNDNENGLGFFTGPTGFRWDGAVFNDAQTEASLSIDWNTFWDVKTTKTEDGWEVEIRVPWASLRFQDVNGETVMGVTSWWYISAKNEVDIYPLVPINWGGMSQWKPSQMQKFRFRGVYSKKPLYLTPYVLAGYQETRELNDGETAYLLDKDPKLEAGLDLKYSLTSNLTLDLTVNTDFAQVEADDQQVNLTRFNLFFPEKRQFFQERASIFDFSFENFNRLFYSRRIGINDDGDPVRIYGGARLQGRVGKSDVGFLTMQTEAPFDSLGSENFTVLRMRRQAINPFSYIGGIFLNRTDFNGNYNSAYGLDAIIRVTGDEYLSAKWVQSFANGKANEVFSLDPARIFVQWERRRYDGLAYKLAYSKAGKDWSPSMGFEERESFNSWQGELSHGWLMGEKSKLLRMRAFLKTAFVKNFITKKTQSAQLEPGIEMETKTGWSWNASARYSKEYVEEPFELGDAEIPAGNYGFTQFNAGFFSPFGSLFGIFGNAAVGSFYDGNLVSISLAPRYKISSHLNLDGFYQYNRGSFSDRNQSFGSHLARIKLEYLLDTKFSTSAFLQYNSLDQVFVPNLRIRYNPKEGNDLYIVFNDLLNSNRRRELPQLPVSDSRVVVVKYTYTFAL
ncbi:MAG TPA: hypothetical protein ENJ95_21925 [Bacteroidetes bacterium]|nr:hypothetical protein [Bacteroidota bacterium]